jgi:serine/threonine protein kinase
MRRNLAGERYEIEDRLGHGGMATVYRARDLKLDREVAIKLLADNFAVDDAVRKRFSREARLAARLDHPNVVQVFDVGEEEDRLFIVMEHVEGAPSRTGSTAGAGPSTPTRPSGFSASSAGTRSRPREEAGPPRHQAAEPAAARLR